jgi:kynurenine formamidase
VVAVEAEHGTTRLGIETLPQVVTRGLLLHIAAVRGTEGLEPGDVITPDDAEAALASHGLRVERGDSVLFHTGWGALWDTDGAAYMAGEPGPGMALASCSSNTARPAPGVTRGASDRSRPRILTSRSSCRRRSTRAMA